MSVYVVGDIQGCYDELQLLLKQLSFDPAKDKLWSCGDLVNRGPKSLKTMRFCRSLGDSFVNVLGNHDLHLLAVARGHRKIRSVDTFQKVLIAPDRDELLEWMRKMPLFHYDESFNIAMVHAGVPPMWGLKKSLKLSREVSDLLVSDRCDEYFASMYGNKPLCWNDELSGPERWRIITNYFTRMRFCDAKGKLELLSTAAPENAPKGYAPWYTHDGKLLPKTPVFFGHWASLMGKSNNPRAIALDTGCAWGGQLTACEISEGFPRQSVKALR